MGGNIFTGVTEPISINRIEYTYKEYKKEFLRLFPNKSNIFDSKNSILLGSTGKKDISGDIDIGIDSNAILDPNNIEASILSWGFEPLEVNEQYLIYKKRARTATDIELKRRALLTFIVKKVNNSNSDIKFDDKKIGSGSIFSYFPQYDNFRKYDTFVQIDWMIGDIKWLEFSYYSDKYDDIIKGLHRTQLLLSIYNYYGYTFSHNKGIIDKETKELVVNTPKEAIALLSKLLNINISKKDLNNYFFIMDKLKQINKKDFNSIINIYLKILDKTRCDIPYDLREIWIDKKDELNLTGKFLPENSYLKNKGFA